ncbi:MAG: FG-GAP-like repeat-containing protein [Acidobacteriaceae bacterium]
MGQASPAILVSGHGRPLANLHNPQSLKVDYKGRADVVSTLKAGAAPTTLATGDFDADGAPDLVSGYKTASGGIVTLLRGNPDAFAPRDPALYPAALKGKVPATFLSVATAFAVPESPDFLATGDFNRDGYRDLLVGTNGGGLYVLAGDGKGSLGTPHAVPLTGAVRTMDVSDSGYVAVSVDGRVAVLAPSTQGLTEVGSYATPALATSLAWGSLGSGLDLAVGAGSNVMLIYSPLSGNRETETVTLPFAVQALAIGDYIWDRDGRQEIAVLGSDGAVRILQHGVLDTRPLTTADSAGRRAALRARRSGLRNPMALGEWTVAKQLPATGASLAGRASRSTFSSPRLAAASTHDLMVVDAGRNQVSLLDTSGKEANASAAIAFAGTPVAAVALRQKINAGRDLVVLTSSAVEPIVTEDAPDPTYNVNTTADDDSVGACAQNSTVTSSTGTVTLREAVCEANNSGAATSVINLPAGTYDLAISTNGGNGSSSTASGELQVGLVSGANITISGAGQNSTIIQQVNGKDRIIEQDQLFVGNIPVTLQNLTLTGGYCDDDSGLDCLDNGGGAVLGGAPGDDLTFTNVTVSYNQSNVSTTEYNAEDGGALSYVGGTLTITGSTFTNNQASSSGGAIWAEVGDSGAAVPSSFIIANSTFTGNEALADNAANNEGTGGAIRFDLAAGYPASITGSTFTGNQVLTNNVNEPGGAIDANGDGTLSISNSRIVGNTAPGGGTGAYLVTVSPTLNDNWWGCNAGPGASGCDSILQDVSGTNEDYVPTSWLVLSISAGSTQVAASGSTGLTADLTHDNLGTSGLSVPDGTPVSFGATLGTISGAGTSLTSGTGTATFNAGSSTGSGSGTATVDNQTASVTIDVTNATTTSAAVEDAATNGAWTNAESAGASAFATASVNPGGSGTPTGTVTYTFYTGGTCSSSGSPSMVTLSGGVAPPSSIFGPLGAGTYSLSATYSGDSTHAGSSSACSNFSVNKAQPTTSVASNLNPSTPGQSVTFTATVSGGYAPSGLVGFTSNGVAIINCGGVSLSSGRAQCTTSSLATGTDAIVATYSGDGNNLSSSGTLSGGQKVGIGSCATSNPNPNPNPQSFAAVGDFNGDCKSDILWRNTSTDQVYVWLMNGTTYPSSGSPGSPTSDWVIQGTGDFNGDGYADILWRNSTTGEVFIWLMNGTTFTSSGSLGYVSSDWSIAGVGDFNGDGKADILWRNSTTGQVYLWLMNGTTMAGGGSVTYVSSDWSIVGIGDFNGDGMADILWRNSSTGQLYIWVMNGTTLTSSENLGYVSLDWSIAGVGDFNGDGTSDILWRNSSTGQVYVWFITGAAMTGGGSVSYVSSDWVIQGVGDYDGSGRAGILWRNSTTEQVYIWLMNGATLTSSGSPGAPDASWQIAALAP